jgi:3-methyladenine DNA glycosylase AlkD
VPHAARHTRKVRQTQAKVLDIDNAVSELRRHLAVRGTRERATFAKRYLKSDLAFLGASVPDVRAAAKAFVRTHPDLTGPSLRRLSEALWRSDVHELRAVAIGILELRQALLGARDAAWLVALLNRADTWAHVDWLAVKVLGKLVEREPSVKRKLDTWAKHQNFWVRCSVLLAFHDPLLAGAGDFEHFARLAVPMLAEREFFIRKAIGWVLRSCVRRGKARTLSFVEAHATALSPLSFREATRNLTPRERARLTRLRQSSAVSPATAARGQRKKNTHCLGTPTW